MSSSSHGVGGCRRCSCPERRHNTQTSCLAVCPSLSHHGRGLQSTPGVRSAFWLSSYPLPEQRVVEPDTEKKTTLCCGTAGGCTSQPSTQKASYTHSSSQVSRHCGPISAAAVVLLLVCGVLVYCWVAGDTDTHTKRMRRPRRYRRHPDRSGQAGYTRGGARDSM